jgi:hypothetical protein
MGLLSAVGKVFKVITGPLGVLEDWANEPLKRWENKRDQENRDREVERRIREQTGVETVKSDLRRQEAEHQANLEIRMRTEIERINAETEQWTKDKEFERMKNVAEAVANYRERLTDLQLNTIRAIGEMDIELRAKAQDLILTKTREYKALQDQAQKDAEEEFTRILDKFSGNERILDIMISSAEKKLASVIEGTSQFLLGLNEDIQKMNANIDLITRSGQSFIDRQIETQFNGLSLPRAQSSNQQVEDAEAEDVS